LKPPAKVTKPPEGGWFPARFSGLRSFSRWIHPPGEVAGEAAWLNSYKAA